MDQATDSIRLANAQEFLAHIGKPELGQALELLSPDVTYHVLGDHALAGTFSGRHEVAAHLGSLFDISSGRFDALKQEDWMVGQLHVAALVLVQVEASGALFRGRHLILMRFDPDNQIDQVTVFFEDLAAAERFYGRVQ